DYPDRDRYQNPHRRTRPRGHLTHCLTHCRCARPPLTGDCCGHALRVTVSSPSRDIAVASDTRDRETQGRDVAPKTGNGTRRAESRHSPDHALRMSFSAVTGRPRFSMRTLASSSSMRDSEALSHLTPVTRFE